MDAPEAPRPALPSSQWGRGGRGLAGLGRAAAASASSSSPALNPGLDRAELCVLPKGGGPGEGRFVPRSRSQNRVRLSPAVFPVRVRR